MALPVCVQVLIFGRFFVFVSLIDISIVMTVAMAYYLLFQGCRRWYFDCFAWLLLQSLFALFLLQYN